MIGKKFIIVEHRRRLTIPRLIVFSESIQEFLRPYVTLTDLPRDVSACFELFGKDYVVGPKLGLQAIRRAFPVALDIAVPAGQIGCARRRAGSARIVVLVPW